MVTVTVYPIATTATQWTPSAGGADHHLLLDEVGAPDDTDYIQAGAENKTDDFTLGQCPDTIDRITQVKVKFRVKGIVGGNSPALRADVLLNGGSIAAYEGSIATGGVWSSLQFTATGLNIIRADWNAGTPTLRLLTKNGDTGYPDFFSQA